MATFLGFGTGKDGAIPSSGIYSSTKAYCSGTAASLNLTPSSTTGFTAGDFVLIHQSRGTGAGAREINRISSIGGGVLVMSIPLENTYTTSGASVAQVVEINQYSGGTIAGTLTCAAWNGETGGILPIMVSGILIVTGSLEATGKGFVGGPHENAPAYSGESYAAAIVRQWQANYGGGGGAGGGGGVQGGGGGGHGTTGATANGTGGSIPGEGGSTYGASDLSSIHFGSGGGGGLTVVGGDGGAGGGVLFVFANNIICSSGYLQSNGGAGGAGTATSGGGGGGAGGSIIIKARSATIGTSRVRCTGGAGGHSTENGGAGGKGRTRIEACTLSGSISSTYYGSFTNEVGGQDWCGITHGIL